MANEYNDRKNDQDLNNKNKMDNRNNQEEKRDPVCGAKVNSSEHEGYHNGKKHCFCSKECKDKFLKNPQNFK